MTVSLNLFGVRKAYMFEQTSLSTPTYATGVEVTCIRNVQWTKRINEIIEKGEDRICFASSHTDGLDFTIEFGGTNLAVESVVFGHTLTEDAGPPVTSKMVMSIADVPGNFGFIAKMNGKGPGGSAHVGLHNCVALSDGYMQAQQDNLASTVYNGIAYASATDDATLAGVMFFAATDQSISTTWGSNSVVS